jgi:3-hydroxybutyryl-CoA dehydrogenase
MADAHAPAHAILASNAFDMSITKMGAVTGRADKVLGIHFFNPVMLMRRVDEGHLGKKSGKGIYEWPAGARPSIDPGKADPDFDVTDIICLQVNEGTKLLQDGVTHSAAEIDKAVINGGGSPFGPFALAKGMGWDKAAKQCEAISERLGIQWFMPTQMLKQGQD